MLRRPQFLSCITKFEIVLLLAIAFFVQFAHADCLQFYPLGQKIAVPGSVELCNSFYVVEYDTARNAPIVSAEKYRSLPPPPRVNAFHPDTRLAAANRPIVLDYMHTPYDKGHLTPADDATTPVEMHDTFLLSNMGAQDKHMNEDPWRMLEMKVRREDPDYIVTGLMFADNPKTIGKHKVPVPSAYFKLTYKAETIAAYYCENTPTATVQTTTVETIESMTGLKFPRYPAH